MPALDDAPRVTDVTTEAVDGGSVELMSNVLRGVVRFSNQNPEITAILAANPWSLGSVVANSTRPAGFSAATTSVQFSGPAQYSFEMLVEAGAGGQEGVTYTVAATANSHHSFAPLTGVTVKPRSLQPNPTDVLFERCTGVVQFQFGTDASCQTPATTVTAARVSGWPAYPYQGRYIVYAQPGVNTSATLEYYVKGNDGRVHYYSRGVQWNPACDEVVRICTVPPTDHPPPAPPPTPPPPSPPPPKGALTGPWEVIGEPSRARYHIYAYGFSDGAWRYVSPLTSTSPVNDPSTWWTISGIPQGTGIMFGTGYLRSGRAFTQFRTPDLHPNFPTGGVTVVADKTTPVMKLVNGELRYPFVMRPAYFYGSIKLADPYLASHPTAITSLQSLWFEADYDDNGDGIPNDMNIGNRGSYLAAVSNWSGYSITAFANNFQAATGALASTYELVLPEPYDLPHSWTQKGLWLRFWSEGRSSSTRPGLYNPERFRYGNLGIIPGGTMTRQLGPDERFRIDHEYCFNEVQVEYTPTVGALFNPRADVTGSFSGTDWRGLQTSYSLSDAYFFGTPAVLGYSSPQQYAQPRGTVSMALPQGSFIIKPSAYMVNSNGGVNTANFAPFSVTLGCGQRLKLVPPLAVIISSLPGCAGGATVPVSGVVRSSPSQVDRIWYQVNGGPEVTLCTNCGTDPGFSFDAALQSCGNTIQVSAFTDGLPEPATGSVQVVWDDPADGPSCPGTYCTNRPPVARCRGLTVPADSACSGCASVNDGSYDPDKDDTLTCVQTPDCPYTLGARQVTLTCTDSAGLSSSCVATVNVRDDTPPHLTCPAELPALECREGGATASYATSAYDNCGGVTTTCSPASGATFPLGATTAACTATDGAGNRASCGFTVTVEDTAGPSLTCPAPVTAECTGGDGTTTLTPPPATAADTCLLADVSNPPTSPFPLGTTPLAYSATDTAGHQASCSSSVTVADTQAPALALNGDSTVSLVCGQSYVEQGASATDACLGNLTPQVVVSGTVNERAPGQYTLTYSVADASGNQATASRIINILAAAPGEGPGRATWTMTGRMNEEYIHHTLTLLSNGKVLLAGGYNNSAELYDPASGTWSYTTQALTERRHNTATLLADGRVLFAGGANGGLSVTAEVYEPLTAQWLPTGNMNTRRRHHTATRLADGRVLVAGGGSNGTGVTAELYDPASGTWTPTGSMASSRRYHTATRLADGRVLVAGGQNDSGVLRTSAELYDPATGTWSPTGNTNVRRRYHTATLLPGGLVLVAGGDAGEAAATAELYDPASGTWAATGGMTAPRHDHTATLLPDGRVLVAGGYDSSSGILKAAEVYDPCSGTWLPTPAMEVERYGQGVVLLPSGLVLVAGGYSNGDQASSELYDFDGP